MHQVWRKTQGLPWEPSVSGGLAANVEHLVSVEAKPNPQPIPADALGLAFGALSHPKLVKQITDPSLVLRQKALAHVCEEIRSTKEFQSFLVAGLVPAANTAAGDADQAVRTSASRVLARAARDHAGQEQMLEHASVAVLLKLLADGVGEVRANVLAAIRELGRARAGAAALVAADSVTLLVGRSVDEEAELQGAALAALLQCMSIEAGLLAAISADAIEKLLPVLDAAAPAAREQSAYCLAALTVRPTEKQAALKAGVVPKLVALLRDPNAPVRTAAAGGLMSMAADVESKKAAVDAGAVAALAPLLDESLALELRGAMDETTSKMTVNVAKCMALLSEDPRARKQLQPCLNQLRPLAESAQPLVQKHASAAVAAVAWKPTLEGAKTSRSA